MRVAAEGGYSCRSSQTVDVAAGEQVLDERNGLCALVLGLGPRDEDDDGGENVCSKQETPTSLSIQTKGSSHHHTDQTHVYARHVASTKPLCWNAGVSRGDTPFLLPGREDRTPSPAPTLGLTLFCSCPRFEFEGCCCVLDSALLISRGSRLGRKGMPLAPFSLQTLEPAYQA